MSEEIEDSELYHILIVHPKDQSVLAGKDGKLPAMFYYGFLKVGLDKLCASVCSELGLPFDLIMLRTECAVPGRHFHVVTLLVFEVPDYAVPKTVEGLEWIPKDDVKDVSVEPPRSAVSEYLCKYSVHGLDIHSERLLPSSKPGWFDSARAWTVETLSKAGYEVKSVYQEGNSGESSMLVAVDEDGSNFYMKAVHPFKFNDEASVTLALGKEMPDDFLTPLVVDLERRYILMQDYGSSFPFDNDLANSNPELFRSILSAWAEVQIRSVLKTKELQTSLPVMDGYGFKHKIEEMFADPEWWTAQQEGMREAEKCKYDNATYKKMYLSYVDELCRKIAEYKVPMALVHGDLNAVNTIRREGPGFWFIDFAWTCWGFPFFDAVQFAGTCGAKLRDLDFYLEMWSEFERMERLRELLHLVDDLYLIRCHSISYQLFRDSEESNRCTARHDLLYPVCRALGSKQSVQGTS